MRSSDNSVSSEDWTSTYEPGVHQHLLSWAKSHVGKWCWLTPIKGKYNEKERNFEMVYLTGRGGTEKVVQEKDLVCNVLPREKCQEMESKPGQYISFQGSRRSCVAAKEDQTVCVARPDTGLFSQTTLVLGVASQSTPAIPFQAEGKLCAINSLANAITIPQDVLAKALKEDPSLQSLVSELRVQNIALFKKITAPSKKELLQVMLEKGSGRYVAQHRVHCFIWDAETKMIIDPDPKFTTPVSIQEMIQQTDIRELERVYEILPPASKKRKFHST